MHLIVGPIIPVSPGLLDQMSPVGGRIDQDILRLRLKTALYDCLEILVLDLELFKRQIVHVDDEPIVAVLDLRDDALQVLELVLVDFDHSKALAVIAVQDRLDARGLAGARVSVQKDVVGHAPLHKSLCICDQLLFLQLVADQVLQLHVARRRDRDQEFPSFVLVVDAESLVQAELAHSVFLVKAGDDVIHLLFRRLLALFALHRLDPLAQLLDLLADASVEDPLRLSDRRIVLENAEAVHSQRALDRAEIIVKQFPEDPEVAQRERVDAALVGPHLLGYQRKRRLRSGDQIGQIVVPQVLIKAVLRGEVQQPMHLLVDLADQRFPVIVSFIELPADLSQTVQDALFPYSSVNNQFGRKTIHVCSPLRLLISVRSDPASEPLLNS